MVGGEPDHSHRAYVGSFFIFGHGGCFGDVGHCDIPTVRDPFDLRPAHQLEPAVRILTVTEPLQAMLASPHFIFRLEEPPAAARSGQTYAISGVDLASRLSFFLWGTGPDEELIAYGKKVVAALGVESHFIIDSSRNGNGPAPATDQEFWCNPEGRALGRPPSAETGEPLLDAFTWVKRPGESDGECKNGPPAGQWFEARAVEMARNAKW